MQIEFINGRESSSRLLNSQSRLNFLTQHLHACHNIVVSQLEVISVPKKASPKGFARVDSESTNTHGWLVRILRGTERRSRFFSDKAHGGKTKSKKRAEECYLAWVSEMKPPASALGKVTKRNSSGSVGVHLATEADARYPNCQYVSYVASWKSEEGKRCSIRFLVNKYGKKPALALAKLAREKHLLDRSKVIALYEKTNGPLKISAKPSSARQSATKPSTIKPGKKLSAKNGSAKK